MKSINWDYLFEIDLPVVREVEDACRRMNLSSIMSFNCDWNEEVVAQFYATLCVNRITKTFHWTIQGKPFSVGYADFANILGFSSSDLTKEKIHESENVLDDGELHFMYDSAYGDIKFGSIHGLTPYYKLLNQLFRYTLCPKGNDLDNISDMSKNLLARMASNQNEFSVFDFIWEEIIICSVSPKKSCHYAPYIFAMIKEVTGVEILTDKGHQVYKPKKGQLQCLLKIGAHAPRRSAQGPLHAPSSSQGPSSSQNPSSSHGPPPHAPKKKGILCFISQGLFACFNVGRHNAQEIHAHRKYVEEQLLKMEERQKTLMAKNDMPHSLIRAPMDFPPPTTFYNPWEELGSSSMMFGAPQMDDDDIEETDEEEEDDVPAADTPTDEEEDDDEDDEDDE
ncbi:hypothetical protein C2845_PM12G07230 [Panicum miliaceum]|uniref:Uncharacterized protein n=1 Tax=Panicum miliaceum TaxID=4540 RepID=A0A3L6QAZ4_PANMI|nr:hypothetical protein C2845_PM12G07230 [Panicum miliaceum]